MATATFVEREQLTDQQVVYRYGPSPQAMDERLTISLATGETTGTTDRAGWVGGWLRHRQGTTGTWPERASIAT
ncbi:hypothetical protein [Klenkia marina]|uniref:hypothetical protein n=1 Tax=Klenkia marina TaxID=1960309 RepID=UPI000B858DF2|nr:hypothetical protein [Klenkia marina]